MNNIPEDCLKKVWDRMQKECYFWHIELTFSFGMYVRNTLRKGGFDWDPCTLDDMWVELIQKAVYRKFGSSKDAYEEIFKEPSIEEITAIIKKWKEK
jgi:hypothetical protein